MFAGNNLLLEALGPTFLNDCLAADPPRRRRGTVDGNPAAPITASVALGHLLSVAENQVGLRDAKLFVHDTHCGIKSILG